MTGGDIPIHGHDEGDLQASRSNEQLCSEWLQGIPTSKAFLFQRLMFAGPAVGAPNSVYKKLRKRAAYATKRPYRKASRWSAPLERME